MSPGSKDTSALPGSTKILLVLVLICSIFFIRPSSAESNFIDYPHDRVKRDNDTDQKGIIGTVPPKHEYRFMVLLLQDMGKSEVPSCHGVLVAPHIIISVAHTKCQILTADKVVAVAGMHDLKQSMLTKQTREVCHIETSKIEGDYKNSYRIYFLSDPFKLNDYVGTINLPFGDTVNFQECMYLGYGYGGNIMGAPLHMAIKMASCNEGPTVICTEPANNEYGHDLGTPLVCTVGNLEFTPGVYAYSPCSTNSGTGSCFASLLSKQFRDWFNDANKKVPKTCYPKS
ncbi:unnamed protein product [Allacma fusca]|uniref:Peptidase S1 domain-containing protein n=1 Tax=Allacma fusca TaxID=39272 RepID=A0A8J2KLF9_9HEXA|nr:unnamed protein product [Allacma fusca]